MSARTLTQGAARLQLPPPSYQKRDYCSFWFETLPRIPGLSRERANLRSACRLHDWRYHLLRLHCQTWSTRDLRAFRLFADKVFRSHVNAKLRMAGWSRWSARLISTAMYYAVRVGGRNAC